MWQRYAPHICLLYGQFAHLLGYRRPAARCYRSCLALIKPGSELGLVTDVCLHAVEEKLVRLQEDDTRREDVQSLAERCRASMSAGLTAVEHLLRSLTEAERVAAK